MRKPFHFILIIAIMGCFYGCKEHKHKPKTKVNFNAKIKEFKNNINKVNSTITLADSLQNEETKIIAERDEGKISDLQAKKRLAMLDSTLGRKLAKSINLHSAKKLPDWARKLGLIMPVGMKPDLDNSQVTSAENQNEGFNSVVLVFKGNYNTAMQQAAIIAKSAHVPLTKEYKTAFEMKKKFGEEIIKGAVYMNFDMGSPVQPKYAIAITVTEDGTLTISATNTKGMESHLKINSFTTPKGGDSL